MSFDSERWRAISAVKFDDPAAAFSFTDRLARDNRWTRRYAARVVEEYRRFTYLAVTAGHEVTPSDEVDQAWHLHLTYTRHYWGPFCEALGRKLHHGPTAGGGREDARYRSNYAATLASYATAFGETPPADIWPPTERRFAVAPHMVRVDTAANIVLPRRTTHQAAAALGALGAAGAAGAAFANSGAQSLVERLQSVPPLALIVAAVVIVALIGVAANRASAKAKSSGGTGCGGAVGGGGGKSSDGPDGGGCSSGCGGGGCGGS